MTPATQLLLLDVPPDPDVIGQRLAVEVAARYFTLAGRCSGIPECCIAAFVHVRLHDRRRWFDELRDRGVDYRRCEDCARAGRVVAVRACPGLCVCRETKEQLFTMPARVRLAWLELMEPCVLRTVQKYHALHPSPTTMMVGESGDRP